MKKVLLTVSAAMLILAACSKDDSPSTPPTTNDVLIRGDWNGAYLIKTGFIAGVAIEKTDTVGTAFVDSLNITLYQGVDKKDSIKGTFGLNQTALKGAYTLDIQSDPNVIDASLDLGTGVPFLLKGNAAISKDSLIVSKGAKEAVEFGDKTSDSTHTVVAFSRKK